MLAPGDYSSQSEAQRVEASMTSSVERLPKFGIAFSSDSDCWTRSPTVCTPARFRQL